MSVRVSVSVQTSEGDITLVREPIVYSAMQSEEDVALIDLVIAVRKIADYYGIEMPK